MREKKLLIGIVSVLFVLIFIVVAVFWYRKNDITNSNFFAYAVDLKNEGWTYMPRGLNYGMSVEEVIKAERLKEYSWEKENEILRTQKTVKKFFSEIKELEFVKRYFFDSEGGLASIRYELIVDSGYEETIRQMLYEQAKAYMPKENQKTNLDNLLDYETLLFGPWNKVVVWEDVSSDVVMGVSRPAYDSDADNEKTPEELLKEKDVVVSLVVSRYQDRLSQEKIDSMREQYPICKVIFAPLVDVIPVTLEYYLWESDTWVYGEAVSNEYTSENSQYEMRILDDTEGILTNGEMISTWYNSNIVEHELYPVDGMRLVVLVDSTIYKGEEKRWFNLDIAYYVTEDGYVISTFDENKKCGILGNVVSESTLSGLKLEDLMRKLKK